MDSSFPFFFLFFFLNRSLVCTTPVEIKRVRGERHATLAPQWPLTINTLPTIFVHHLFLSFFSFIFVLRVFLRGNKYILLITLKTVARYIITLRGITIFIWTFSSFCDWNKNGRNGWFEFASSQFLGSVVEGMVKPLGKKEGMLYRHGQDPLKNVTWYVEEQAEM